MLRNVAIMPWSEPVLMTLGTCNAVAVEAVDRDANTPVFKTLAIQLIIS